MVLNLIGLKIIDSAKRVFSWCHLELKRKISRSVQASPKSLTARFFAPLRMTLWVTKMIPAQLASAIFLSLCLL